MKPAIIVDKISKKYRIGHEAKRAASFGEAVTHAVAAPFRYLKYRMTEATEEDTLWACRDISFEVNKGEVLGVIGANGSGKSTLLKILSRITDPTNGRAVIHGRVNALLEVGVGFHPELTGRENIFLNAALHGMSARETRRKLDEIVEFSGVERFLDTPVKRYSSGMRVRLGFAVAAHLEPDILIVDEVLAVGDMSFQNKCLGKMKDVTSEGRTVLFVSHNMPAVQHLCDACLMLDRGRVVAHGETEQVIKRYIENNQEVSLHAARAELGGARREGNGHAGFQWVELQDESGRPIQEFQMGSDISFRMSVLAKAGIPQAKAAVMISDAMGRVIVELSSEKHANAHFALTVGQPQLITARLLAPNFLPGHYSVKITLKDVRAGQMLDSIQSAHTFDVVPANVYGTGRIMQSDGAVFMRSVWQSDAGLQAAEP
jgi:lipopolysaccharide transport system ATP-binding protein